MPLDIADITPGLLVSWIDPWKHHRSGVVLFVPLPYRGEMRVLVLMANASTSSGRKTAAIRLEEIYETMPLAPNEDVCQFAAHFGPIIGQRFVELSLDVLIDGLIDHQERPQ